MKKKLTADITPALYIIPIGIVFYGIIIGIMYSSIKDELLLTFLIISSLLSIIAWLLLRQCKDLYFDKDNIYIYPPTSKKLIEQVDLKRISELYSFGFLIRLKIYNSKNKIDTYYLIPERKTISSEIGTSKTLGYEFMRGKEENNLIKLKSLIKEKQKLT